MNSAYVLASRLLDGVDDPDQMKAVLAVAAGRLAHLSDGATARKVLNTIHVGLQRFEREAVIARDVARVKPVAASMREIAEEVARETGVTVDEMMGRSKLLRIVRARRTAWDRLHRTGRFTTPAIGRFFGRDHSTIVVGIKRHRRALAS